MRIFFLVLLLICALFSLFVSSGLLGFPFEMSPTLKKFRKFVCDQVSVFRKATYNKKGRKKIREGKGLEGGNNTKLSYVLN